MFSYDCFRMTFFLVLFSFIFSSKKAYNVLGYFQVITTLVFFSLLKWYRWAEVSCRYSCTHQHMSIAHKQSKPNRRRFVQCNAIEEILFWSNSKQTSKLDEKRREKEYMYACNELKLEIIGLMCACFDRVICSHTKRWELLMYIMFTLYCIRVYELNTMAATTKFILNIIIMLVGL